MKTYYQTLQFALIFGNLKTRKLPITNLFFIYMTVHFTIPGVTQSIDLGVDDKQSVEFVLNKTHTRNIQNLYFLSNNQTLASVGGDNLIKLWNLDSERNIATLSSKFHKIYAQVSPYNIYQYAYYSAYASRQELEEWSKKRIVPLGGMNQGCILRIFR